MFLQTVLSRCAVFSQGGGRRVDSGKRGSCARCCGGRAGGYEYPLLAATAVFEKDKTLFRAALQVLLEFSRGGADKPESKRLKNIKRRRRSSLGQHYCESHAHDNPRVDDLAASFERK